MSKVLPVICQMFFLHANFSPAYSVFPPFRPFGFHGTWGPLHLIFLSVPLVSARRRAYMLQASIFPVPLFSVSLSLSLSLCSTLYSPPSPPPPPSHTPSPSPISARNTSPAPHTTHRHHRPPRRPRQHAEKPGRPGTTVLHLPPTQRPTRAQHCPLGIQRHDPEVCAVLVGGGRGGKGGGDGKTVFKACLDDDL